MSDEQEQTEKAPIQVNLSIPATLVSRYSNFALIQNTVHEFTLSFFEIMHNRLPDGSKTPPAEVEANCVARIIISAGRMPEFVDVINRNFEKFKKTTESRKSE